MRRALNCLCAAAAVALLPACTAEEGGSSAGSAGTPSASASASPSVSPPVSPSATSSVARPLSGYPVIAHRGGPARHAEESIAAYRATAAQGFALEMDVQRLADGTLVLMHDDTVDRTTDGTGEVRDLTLAQWEGLRLADGTPPPTWDQVIEQFGDDLLVPEVKSPDALLPLIASIRSHQLEDRVVAQSFLPGEARTLAASGIPTMLLTSASEPAGDLTALRDAGVDYIGASAATPDLDDYADRTRKTGLGFAVWIVDDAGAAVGLVRSGAVSVFTDDPWAMRQALRSG